MADQQQPPAISNGTEKKLSRLHMQKHLSEYGLTINIFADTAPELWQLYQQILALIDGTAEQAIETATAAAAARPVPVAQRPAAARVTRPAAGAKTKGNGGVPLNAPLCGLCGQPCTLIRWTDKNTGEQRRAWKCEPCNEWDRS
ncbi:MAG: hypothetical protein A2Y59_06365 [Chloroflexi bacterium RBG_13_52_14]|nr:MAG: hypothetical protein A2Y59_06365 [Chloroflexi bacterium RBG_13_52_14]